MEQLGLTNEFFVGILLPLVVAVLQQSDWPDPVRSIVFLGSCIVAACIMHLANVNDVTTLANSIVYIVLTAGVFYKTLWKPTEVAPRIERATSY